MYIDNRGSNAIDVLDTATNSITKTINLQFYPRSISANDKINPNYKYDRIRR